MVNFLNKEHQIEFLPSNSGIQKLSKGFPKLKIMSKKAIAPFQIKLLGK